MFPTYIVKFGNVFRKKKQYKHGSENAYTNHNVKVNSLVCDNLITD